MTTDGHGDADDQLRAEFVAALMRAGGPRLRTLPPGSLRREFLTLIHRHGSEFGLTLSSVRKPRATLLDAKLEFDARIQELGIQPYEQLSPRLFRRLAEGTELTLEQLQAVAPHSAGRHIYANISIEQLAAGQWGCGVLVGSLFQSWAY